MNSPAMRLLLVEDSLGDARLFKEVLKDVPDVPFEVVHAGLLKDALACLQEQRFAAALLDLSLPDGGGLDMVKEVVACAPQMPILVLTGLIDEQLALNALGVGAQDYIIKGSMDGISIARAIRYAIQRKQFLERIRLLREIDQAISATLDLKEIFTAFLERIEPLFGISASCVHRLDSATGLVQPVVARHMLADQLKSYFGKVQAAFAGLGADGSEPYTLQTLEMDEELNPNCTSVLQIPLNHNLHPWGMISLFVPERPQLSPEESDVLKTIVSRLTVAVQNAQLYESIVNLAEDLRRSNKVKDEFLSIMSHELRTPLNVMMNCAEVLRAGMVGDVTPEQTNILDRLLVQARNQLGLVNGILHVTRMESDKVDVECQDVDLVEFLEEMKADYKISFTGERVVLHWHIPHDLPVINTDRDKIRQVLENLINNAIKFTAAGEIRVSARMLNLQRAVMEEHARQRWIELEVSDTGAGIPEDSLASIFEKFQQLDTTSTRSHGGVGIGLYLVKRFVDLLNGTISLSSQVGKGSTFKIGIPYVPRAGCQAMDSLG